MWKERIKIRFKVYRDLELYKGSNEYLRQEARQLKDQLYNRRHTIEELKNNLVESVNSINLINAELDIMCKSVDELKARRDEFIKRLQSPTPEANNFPDYKYWLSESFIVDNYTPYKFDDTHIDGVSAIKGLGNILKEMDKE